MKTRCGEVRMRWGESTVRTKVRVQGTRVKSTVAVRGTVAARCDLEDSQ